MAKRKIVKKFVRYKKAGYYWSGFRCGVFCPSCGEPAYFRRGIHPKYLCFNCGWTEAPPKLKIISAGNGKYNIYNENIPKIPKQR